MSTISTLLETVAPSSHYYLVVADSGLNTYKCSVANFRETKSITFGSVGTVPTGTIILTGYAPYSGIVNSIKTLKVGTGSITVTTSINNVSITGLSSLVVTTGTQNPNAAGANIFYIGDSITVTLTASSGAADLQGTLNITPR